MNTNNQKKPGRRLRVVSTLPSLITLGNLWCGFASIFYASRLLSEPAETYIFHDWTPLMVAAAMIFLGMIFDGMDGYVARMTKHVSKFGAQLDSMADMVTFGIAPAFLVIQLVNIGTPFFGEMHPKWSVFFDRAVFIVAGVYVACTALRLARFNVETEGDDVDSHVYFCGLPSPGAAGTIASLVLLHQYLLARNVDSIAAYITAITMVSVAFVSALGMVSSLRYSHVVNRFLRDRATFSYVAIVVIVGSLLWIIPQWAIAGGFVSYALSAPVIWILRRGKGGKDADEDTEIDAEKKNEYSEQEDMD